MALWRCRPWIQAGHRGTRARRSQCARSTRTTKRASPPRTRSRMSLPNASMPHHLTRRSTIPYHVRRKRSVVELCVQVRNNQLPQCEIPHSDSLPSADSGLQPDRQSAILAHAAHRLYHSQAQVRDALSYESASVTSPTSGLRH